MVGFCKHGDELVSFLSSGNILDQLNNSPPPKKDTLVSFLEGRASTDSRFGGFIFFFFVEYWSEFVICLYEI
jgi:hypothetical protein